MKIDCMEHGIANTNPLLQYSHYTTAGTSAPTVGRGQHWNKKCCYNMLDHRFTLRQAGVISTFTPPTSWYKQHLIPVYYNIIAEWLTYSTSKNIFEPWFKKAFVFGIISLLYWRCKVSHGTTSSGPLTFVPLIGLHMMQYF